MYNFYKIKSKKNQQEFRHPFFRRDQANDLKYIKRKNVNKKLKQISDMPSKEELTVLSNSNVKEQIDKLQSVLDFIAEQNKTLVLTNKNIVGQLCNSKMSCEAQIRELITMLFVTLNVPHNRLLTDFKVYLASLKINQASIPHSIFIDRNASNIDAVIPQDPNKAFGIGDITDRLLGIYRYNFPQLVSTKMFSDAFNERRQALTVIDNKNDKFSRIISLGETSKLAEAGLRPLRYENSNPSARKMGVSDKRIASMASIKNDGMIEDLNRADYLFNNMYNEKDADAVSLVDFTYTPVTPLFQEDM